MAASPHHRHAGAALLAASRGGHRKAPRQKAPETYEEKLAQLHELREAALHSAPESEEGEDAVGTGNGTLAGRRVCVFSQNFTVFGVSLVEVMGEKMCKLMDLAAKIG